METRSKRALCALGLSLAPILLLLPGGAQAASTSRTSKAHVCVFDHVMLRSGSIRCRPRARHYPADVTTRVEQAIYDGSLTFGIPYSVLYKIAVCESGLNPHASHAGHFGLFQFLPDTFHRGAAQLRTATGVTARSYWNALDSTYVAGYLYATGESRSWACEKGGELPPSATAP